MGPGQPAIYARTTNVSATRLTIWVLVFTRCQSALFSLDRSRLNGTLQPNNTARQLPGGGSGTLLSDPHVTALRRK